MHHEPPIWTQFPADPVIAFALVLCAVLTIGMAAAIIWTINWKFGKKK